LAQDLPPFTDGLLYDNILNGQKIQAKKQKSARKLERVTLTVKKQWRKGKNWAKNVVILHIKSELYL
jgi:hypothetical protein